MHEPGRIEWAPGISSAVAEQLGFELSPHTVVILQWSEALMAEAPGAGAADCPGGHDITYALMDPVQEWIDTGTEPILTCSQCGQATPASECDVYPLFGGIRRPTSNGRRGLSTGGPGPGRHH